MCGISRFCPINEQNFRTICWELYFECDKQGYEMYKKTFRYNNYLLANNHVTSRTKSDRGIKISSML
jgi:hypothetical protein